MPQIAAAIWPWFDAVVIWTKDHEGLGVWIGTSVAILVAWFLSHREYQRMKNDEKERLGEKIDMLKTIVARFQASLRDYASLVRSGDVVKALSFEANHKNDAVHLAAADLTSAPITFWPSLNTYMRFKEYWVCARALFAISIPLENPTGAYTEKVRPKMDECVQRCNELIKSLDAAR